MNILSLIFDQGCLLCGHNDSFSDKYGLCRRCAFPLLFYEEKGDKCRVCGRPLISEDGICMRCRNEDYSFDTNRYFWDYDGVAKTVIGLYKFKGQRRIGRFLALVVYRYLCKKGLENVLLVPAPCSPARLKKTGYNHMEAVCRALKGLHGIPFADVLRRRRGRQLKKLGKQERKEELADKLYMRPKDARKFQSLCQEKHVILIDDVFTTGTTASACSRILKENDAENVDIITFAID
ncbi:MAG: ComF family protein [Spirochaetia bacterium]|nr:ComF family protein [Spirochaetia bacterium]